MATDINLGAPCRRCGLDLGEVRTTALVKDLHVETDQVLLHCPFCAEEIWIDLRPQGIFRRGERFYRWRSGKSAGKGACQLQVGSLSMDFPEEQMVGLTPEKVCYPAIPVFRQVDGSLSFPKWPVRKEYLEFVDMSRNSRSEVLAERNQYRIDLYLKGLEGAETVALPLLQTRSGRSGSGGGDAAMQGVHLVLWPDVPYKDWKRYFLRFGCEKEGIGGATGSDREVRVFGRARPRLDSNQDEWVPLEPVSPDGVTRFACVGSRPSCAAVEFESTTRKEVIAGGIWEIPSVVDEYPVFTTELGIDFGTSNTFIAWRSTVDAAGTAIPVDNDCNKFLIHGSDLPRSVDFADTWPLRRGFGKHKVLFPSEILTTRKLQDTRASRPDVDQWRPVVDFGIPSGGMEVRFNESEHTISEFKWQESVSDPFFRAQFDKLQRAYLEFLLLFAAAQLAKHKGKPIGKNVTAQFSYPLAFDDGQWKRFKAIIGEVAISLKQQTGIEYTCELSLDESRAAASKAGKLGPEYGGYLYVDIGGGSTDVALLRVTGETGPGNYLVVDSFKYAGGALVSAFARGNCLNPEYDLTRFRRVVREVGQIAEIEKLGTVFRPERKNLYNSKTGFWLGYLWEFLARILASHMVSGEWAHRRSEEERKAMREEGYLIAFHPLGNGWGFGQIIDPKYARDVFSRKLTTRTNAIIAEAVRNGVPTDEPPKVRVKCEDAAIEDPKSAVALGLLGGESTRTEKGGEWSCRTIVGWTTMAGRLRRIPWYLPLTDRGFVPEEPWAKETERLPVKASLDCPENEWPTFPPELRSPHELDPDLNHTREHIMRECVQEQKDWFIKSPFHVLLEKLFKPKLQEIG